jgi:hypothetical protein
MRGPNCHKSSDVPCSHRHVWDWLLTILLILPYRRENRERGFSRFRFPQKAIIQCRKHPSRKQPLFWKDKEKWK